MSFRDTASFGKRVEYSIISKMLMSGLDVYTPLVDDHGVDCIVKKEDGSFVEVQIKGRSSTAKNPGCFTVDNHQNAVQNFYFIFYVEEKQAMWVMPSSEFVRLSHLNTAGKNTGRRKVELLTRKKQDFSKKFESFITNNFDLLK